MSLTSHDKKILYSVVLTNFGQGGHKDPESDDEGNLDSLELHVEDVVLRCVSMVAVVPEPFLLQGILTTVFK